jgi:predicted transcriptional regulator
MSYNAQQQRRLNLAAQAAQAAASVRARTGDDVRRESEFERRRLAKFAQQRRDKCDTAAQLAAYVSACGYAEGMREILFCVMAAVTAEGGLESCSNWKLGFYLSCGDATNIEALTRSKEEEGEKMRRALAERWTRAWNFALGEFRRTGYWSLIYKPGGRDSDTKKVKASQFDPIFVQKLVEISERELELSKCPEMKGNFYRVERTALAGRQVVGRMNCKPETEEGRKRREELDACERAERAEKRAVKQSLKQPETPALRKARAVREVLGKVEQYRDNLAAELRTLDLSAEEKADVIRQAVELFAEGLSDLLPVVDETEEANDLGSPERDLTSIRGHEFEDVSRNENDAVKHQEINKNAGSTTTPCHENVTFERKVVDFPSSHTRTSVHR